MKAAGIVRKVDTLGRIVLPMELRKTRGIKFNNPMEINVEDDKVILIKYLPSCTFCSSKEDVKEFKNKNVCKECVDGIAAL